MLYTLKGCRQTYIKDIHEIGELGNVVLCVCQV